MLGFLFTKLLEFGQWRSSIRWLWKNACIPKNRDERQVGLDEEPSGCNAFLHQLMLLSFAQTLPTIRKQPVIAHDLLFESPHP